MFDTFWYINDTHTALLHEIKLNFTLFKEFCICSYSRVHVLELLEEIKRTQRRIEKNIRTHDVFVYKFICCLSSFKVLVHSKIKCYSIPPSVYYYVNFLCFILNMYLF